MKHYYRALLELAEALVNSFDRTLDEPEHLGTLDDVRERLLRGTPLEGLCLRGADLDALRQLRPELRRIFQAESPQHLRDELNRQLSAFPFQVELRHGERDEIVVRPAATAAVEQLHAACLLGLAWGQEQYGFGRFRTCAATSCEDVFVDTSKGGGRRFCGPRCASRTHVRAYRNRQTGEETM